MYDLEPYYQWRDYYIASEDKHSPYYNVEYDEFNFFNKIYNYLIHPQWDAIGSNTLYVKVLYTDYTEGVAIIELLGEWNDTLHNDIMNLKRELVDAMTHQGITKYILIGEKVLNFHASDDCYYEEWYEDLEDDAGWVVLINFLPHVLEEMTKFRLNHYMLMGERWTDINWRAHTPHGLVEIISYMVEHPKLLSGPGKNLTYYEENP